VGSKAKKKKRKARRLRRAEAADRLSAEIKAGKKKS
jgi:hypothetical protein